MGGKGGDEVAYQPDNSGFDMAEMMAGFEMGGMEAPSGPSADEINAQNEEREAERKLTQGLNDRDSLYGEYLDAGGAATDFINNQIADERSNAALLGIDYNLSDADKQNRIDNYFASIWGEGSQGDLEASFKEFGYIDDTAEEDWQWKYNRGADPTAAPDVGEADGRTPTGQVAPIGTGGNSTIATDSSLLGVEDEISILGGG